MSLLALAYWQETGIKLGLALAVIPTTSLVLVYLFLFKMMAFMQSRLCVLYTSEPAHQKRSVDIGGGRLN